MDPGEKSALESQPTSGTIQIKLCTSSQRSSPFDFTLTCQKSQTWKEILDTFNPPDFFIPFTYWKLTRGSHVQDSISNFQLGNELRFFFPTLTIFLVEYKVGSVLRPPLLKRVLSPKPPFNRKELLSWLQGETRSCMGERSIVAVYAPCSKPTSQNW